MGKLDWRRTQYPDRPKIKLADEAEHLERDRAAKWLERATQRPNPVPKKPVFFPRSAITRKGKPVEAACRCGCATAKFFGKGGVTVACSDCGQHITKIFDPQMRKHIVEAYGPSGSVAAQSGVDREEQQRLAHFRSI